MRLISGETPIDKLKLQEISRHVESRNVSLKESASSVPEGHDGWEGGVVWLVPTDKPIADWKPIAKRAL